ncbi:MAG: signal peptide peptidase SppA [bacterium]
MNKKILGGLVLAAVIILTAAGLLARPDRRPAGAAAGRTVGVIYIEGMILGGPGGSSLLGGAVAGSDTVIAQLKQAREDPAVRAVVLRINSPGGSSAAAQEIGVEVGRLREAGKTVVASMGDTAASGGYWVAALADKIVANPSTTTGSIGVIIQYSNYEELYRKAGIEMHVIKSGPHKDMGSAAREMTEAEKELLQAMVDDVYEQFVDVVAAGRGMEPARVREIADGRILTGRQALDLGLVDTLGNFYDAIDEAAAAAGLGERYTVREYGRASIWQMLRSGFGSRAGLPAAAEPIVPARFLLLPGYGVDFGN